MTFLNPLTLESFQELMAPHDLQDFLRRACEELRRTQELMAQFFAAEAWPELRSAAHRLKGSLGSIGCDPLYLELDSLEIQLLSDPIHIPTVMQMDHLFDVARHTDAALVHAAAGCSDWAAEFTGNATVGGRDCFFLNWL